MKAFVIYPAESEQTNKPKEYQIYLDSPWSRNAYSAYGCIGVGIGRKPEADACRQFLENKFGMEFKIRIGNWKKSTIGSFDKKTCQYSLH